jgi:hypothetical protein
MPLHLSFTPIKQPDELAPEKRLALAIIVAAWEDKDLIFFNSPLFSFWCQVAGVDPGRIRRRLGGCRWLCQY